MRFGFHYSWNVNKLKEFTHRIITKNKRNESNLILTISAENGLVNQAKFFNRKVASDNLSGYYLLKKGDFAYNKSYSNNYPWGAIKRLDKYDKGVVSALYICFSSNDDIDSDYLKHYFESNKWNHEVSDIAVEGARNHGLLNIPINDFFNTNHYLPSLTEQKKIACFLNLIESRLDTQKKIIEEIKFYKKYILNKIFIDKGLLIEGKEMALNNVLIPGIKEPVNTSLYKKINVHLNLNGISYATVTRKMSDIRPFYLRHKGELIIGKQNYFNGSIAIIPEKYDNTICSNAIMSFMIKKEYDDEFIYYAISNNSFLKFRSHIANGTGQKELSEKDFLNFKIKIPVLARQKIISNSLRAIEGKIINEEKILKLYLKQKDYLLNKMFI